MIKIISAFYRLHILILLSVLSQNNEHTSFQTIKKVRNYIKVHKNILNFSY